MSNKLIDKLNQGPVICAEGFYLKLKGGLFISW